MDMENLLSLFWILLGLAAVWGVVQLVPVSGRVVRLQQSTFGSAVVSVTATSTNASPTLTAAGAMAGVSVGSTVTGPGITPPVHVLAADDAAHTVTISANATTGAGAGTGTFVFTPAVPGGLQGRTLHLFKDTFNPGIGNVLADFSAAECDYTGYSAVALTFTASYIPPTNIPQCQSQLANFVPTGTAVANNVGGGWIDDGTNVLLAFKLTSSVGLNGPTSELALVVLDSYPPGSLTIQVLP